MDIVDVAFDVVTHLVGVAVKLVDFCQLILLGLHGAVVTRKNVSVKLISKL